MSHSPNLEPREKIRNLGSQVMVNVTDPSTKVSRSIPVNVFEPGAPPFVGGGVISEVCNSIQKEFRSGMGHGTDRPISRPTGVEPGLDKVKDKDKTAEARTPSL